MTSYQEFLEKCEGCPFCSGLNQVICETQSAIMVYALAPYTKDHLLVVPKSHVEEWNQLTPEQNQDIWKLIDIARQYVTKNDSSRMYNLLLRAGATLGREQDRSQLHLHWHIIPDIPCAGIRADGLPVDRTRPMVSDQEIARIKNEICQNWGYTI